jgi:hypothetical protein
MIAFRGGKGLHETFVTHGLRKAAGTSPGSAARINNLVSPIWNYRPASTKLIENKLDRSLSAPTKAVISSATKEQHNHDDDQKGCRIHSILQREIISCTM